MFLISIFQGGDAEPRGTKRGASDNGEEPDNKKAAGDDE